MIAVVVVVALAAEPTAPAAFVVAGSLVLVALVQVDVLHGEGQLGDFEALQALRGVEVQRQFLVVLLQFQHVVGTLFFLDLVGVP